jgi:hypothetical protein
MNTYIGDAPGLSGAGMFPTSEQECREDRIAQRERELWADLEVVADSVQWADALMWSRESRRTDSTGRAHITPANYKGTEALTALQRGDFAVFGAIVHKAIAAEIREQAEEYVGDQDARSTAGDYL